MKIIDLSEIKQERWNKETKTDEKESNSKMVDKYNYTSDNSKHGKLGASPVA